MKLTRKVVGLAALLPMGTLSLALVGTAAQSAWRTYHANDPVGRNVVAIFSDAPLETMLTTTSAVTGSVEFDIDHPKKAPRAKFIVDAATLDTGIELRNQHMRSAKWLDTTKYPKISFTLTKLNGQLPRSWGRNKTQTVRGTARGNLYFHGRTRPVNASLEVRLIAQSAQTKERLPGDLMHVRASFPLSLKEFGVQVPEMAKLKIADEQQVRVDVYCSTGSPAPG